MNFDLASNSNKMIILVVAGIALLLALNVYQKQIGKNVASMLCVVVIIVVGFFGYRLLNEDEDEDNELNNLLNGDLSNMGNVANNMGNAVGNVANNMGNAVENVAHNVENVAHNVGNAVENVAHNVENVAHNVENAVENVAHNVHPNNSANVVEHFESSNNGGNNQNGGNVNENGNNNGSVNNNNNLNSQNLLPEGDTLFSNVNPSNNGGVINASLLNAGHHIGVNTQGCSLRNANRGLRSEPPNPQTQVSPWLQTTICPDLYRKPLE